MRRKAYRPRKRRKPKAAAPRKPARTATPFKAHKGRTVSAVFRAHKGRHASAFKAHGRRRIAGHGAVMKKARAVKARKVKVVRMKKAKLNLALTSTRG